MTRVALIGYGAMGREIELLAPSQNCKIVCQFDLDNPITGTSNADFDVAIDFSWPDAVMNNVEILAQLGKPLVIGTTGWYSSLSEVRTIVENSGIGCIWGSNFSVGVQTFLRIVRAAAIMANENPDYDVMVHEWHHSRKKDSPSGTAISIAKTIIEEMQRKNHIAVETQHDKIDPSALHVSSARGGDVVGRHMVTLDSLFDTIDIVHNAKSRSGFAQGALIAAKWIVNRKGCYDFTEVFPEIQTEVG